MTIILEYGSFKAFDFVEVNIDSRIEPRESFSAISGKIDITWDARKGLRGVKSRHALAKTIKSCDYHDLISTSVAI